MLYAHEMPIVNDIWFVRVWRMARDNVNVKHNFNTTMKEDDVVSLEHVLNDFL